jgi:hypothetical protein
MAIFTVTTIDDVVNASDGVLSLREAVTQANATASPDTILFAPTLEGRTLTLYGGELVISQDTTINGDQNDDGLMVTLNGRNQVKHLDVTGDQTDLTLIGLRMIDGYSGDFVSGGSISFAARSLNINDCEFFNNAAYNFQDYWGRGGAISADSGIMNIRDSTFISNFSGSGGVIDAEENCEVIISGSEFSDNSAFRGGALQVRGELRVDSSLFVGNSTNGYGSLGGPGGAIAASGTVHISTSTIIGNTSLAGGGGLCFYGGRLEISDTTIADNRSLPYNYVYDGGGLSAFSGSVSIRNSTITGNVAYGDTEYTASGGGIIVGSSVSLELANSVIVGHSVVNGSSNVSDIFGTITHSNGHNVFGSDVLGNAIGDRENVAASTVFAAIDPATGGGLLNAAGIVPLRAGVTNPALGGADRFAIGAFDQLGVKRPAPTGTNPDIGAAESGFAHSKVASANNDTLTGTAAANTLNGLAGHDFLKGLGGNDTLNGGDGNDFLEGGAGNDRLNGGAGIDIANYGDSSARVVVDLRGNGPGGASTAKRGTETDTLTGIEGAIGGGGNDRFWGDGGPNWFQGGGGKDTFTGGAGRDLYDYNLTSASPAGAGRDVITDFAPGIDRIDLMGIDADASVAGNQAFRWVGKAALTGPGEVGYFTSGGNTIVRMSTDADAAAEAEIQLTGIKTLTALDFYL